MRSIDKLHKATRDMKLGNHRVEVDPIRNIRSFIYFQTAIVVANDNNRTFYVNNGGYNTPSTARAINAHTQELDGYTEVPKDEFKKGAAV